MLSFYLMYLIDNLVKTRSIHGSQPELMVLSYLWFILPSDQASQKVLFFGSAAGGVTDSGPGDMEI
jgi:hypothetical protein